MRPCFCVLCVGLVIFVAPYLPCHAEMTEPAISLDSCIEEDAKRLRVSDEAMLVAIRLLCESQMGALSCRVNDPTCSKSDQAPKTIMIRRSREGELGALPGFVDEGTVRSALDAGSPDALKFFANERLLQIAWIVELTLVNLDLRKRETSGAWELAFPGMPELAPGVYSSEHQYPEQLSYQARTSLYPFLRAAQAEVSANTKNVPDSITDPLEASVFFPKYQAIVLLKSVFSVHVIRD